MKAKFNPAFLIIFFLFASCVFGEALKPVKISDFIAEIPPLQNTDCNFRQEKYLKGATKPLVTSGEFKFRKNEGVYFKILKPYTGEISYTNKDYRQINDVILALSDKKYSKIENEFDFYFSKIQNGALWNLALKPKAGKRAGDVIENIEIEGQYLKNGACNSKQASCAGKINKIQILAKNGGRTVIWFN